MNKKFMGRGDYAEDGGPSKAASPAIQHIAGEFKNGEQRCSRCGLMLSPGKNSKKPLAEPGTAVTIIGSKVYVGSPEGTPCAPKG